MPQGFKSKVKSSSTKTTTQQKPTGPKRGPRTIAPKKTAAIKEAQEQRRNNASMTQRVELEMAGRAASGGPLTIMKKTAATQLDKLQAAKEKKK
ncbi:unnamed protein product [Tilletia controversa]|uniref:Uncharacterized protein n=3 Tax=Tilletia TaxID=13289 RepID=A0A8X7MWY0_9BASI|nr:hypothetical protein CF328_g3837 [Tilletia controversa]KAE8199066.1 hypothetical protein CF336_g1382 [Tilletia laevis]KAE8260701.1 hypothetical protein A4X03_0g3722 [Tilletia caries]KAE8202092.1 hypothetical protein CF335_g3546 [Tilletia laevis]KAE8252487.1 hypothetical protein A4X06_0g2154 [Tilletia controversa]